MVTQLHKMTIFFTKVIFLINLIKHFFFFFLICRKPTRGATCTCVQALSLWLYYARLFLQNENDTMLNIINSTALQAYINLVLRLIVRSRVTPAPGLTKFMRILNLTFCGAPQQAWFTFECALCQETTFGCSLASTFTFIKPTCLLLCLIIYLWW
jgi:hypothetical protein